MTKIGNMTPGLLPTHASTNATLAGSVGGPAGTNNLLQCPQQDQLLPRRGPPPLPETSAVRRRGVLRHMDLVERHALLEVNLLGQAKREQLDKQFGKARWPPARPGWTRTGEYQDRSVLVHPDRVVVPASGGRAVDLPGTLDLERLRNSGGSYMFAVSQVGALVIGKPLNVASEVDAAHGVSVPLSYASLTGGGPGRIHGTLGYDNETQAFFIAAAPGSYPGDSGAAEREKLLNVAERFQAAGLLVTVQPSPPADPPSNARVSPPAMEEGTVAAEAGPTGARRSGGLRVVPPLLRACVGGSRR